MRIGMGFAESAAKTAATSFGVRGSRFSGQGSDVVRADGQGRKNAAYNLLQEQLEEESAKNGKENKKWTSLKESGSAEESEDRGEALKIYEAAAKGGENPIKNLISAPKVPYGHMAEGGVIIYNGVLFTCDERSNSICLGDVSDPKQVINITLSGGGHLKVNRANIDQLSKAIGMFSPEDVNLIMRAIHQDTKLQSMQKEIEDMEAGVGEQITSKDNDAAKEDETTE